MTLYVTRTSVSLPRELLKEFKKLAHLKGKSISAYITELIWQELERKRDKLEEFKALTEGDSHGV